ncbi:hypothetical protein FB566_0598 [Stackebrandtia endophytica]|uniref:Uncharacterized protein n=1 Tax=Stackebrandtia endophytica TaxID=1496996 RepID=A0A543ARE7_9ACTN|nr:hypothetical protein [Stackebrandtia endophytica]TQL75106.1 hypothetical protein FB566_0598 [Stackebrandtia endophytica]
MSIVADRLNALTVRVQSPDRNITAQMRGRSDLSLTFAAGSYATYDEESLAAQLSRLATSLWIGLQRGTDEALKGTDVEAVRTPDDAWDEDSRKFLKARREVVGNGRSPGNCVKVETVGMRDWRIRIRPGTLATYHETELIGELLTAVVAARNDYTIQVEELSERMHL